MKHASCRELFRYWNRIRAGAPAPQRTAIEPADIRQVLSDTFILEVAGSRGYRFRLAGTRLCGAYGRELKGLDFLSLWHEPDVDQIASVLSAVSTEAAAVVLGVAAEASRERKLAFELLLLPLVQEGPHYDRILGAMVPMELPYWLGLDPLARQTISSVRMIDEEFRTSVPPLQPVIAPVAAFSPAERRGRFVVLDGGKATR